MEILTVRVTPRTNWIFVRLSTNQGLTGLGEASLGRQNDLPDLAYFFELVRDTSPFDIARYRQRGLSRAATDRRPATAFSALEQAQWDLVGKALDVPAHHLFGGALRKRLPVYANINRATIDRTPEGFAASAAAAVSDGRGFRAIKAAPFDGFPAPDAPRDAIERATDLGIACVEAMRRAVGTQVDIKIDCHSFFDVPRAVDVASRLEPQRLSWYEEPVPPTRVDDTLAIKNAITQRMAGGEFLFGVRGFDDLVGLRAVDVIMPDVKHCGGLQEARHIAAVAESRDISVSPHNPSGPVSTYASAQLCAGLTNFDSLEYQWGEVDWRPDLVDPPEVFRDGELTVPDGPGLGVTLNDRVVRSHLLS